MSTKEEAMTIQEQEQTRAAWDSIAVGYDEFIAPKYLTLAEDALRLADLRPGMRFLDVAAGSGALSIPAARRGAQLLATDISPNMVERLEARAREEGLSNLESRVMDGHALDLENDTFDISGSQFGVMLFPDLARGDEDGGPAWSQTANKEVESSKVRSLPRLVEVNQEGAA